MCLDQMRIAGVQECVGRSCHFAEMLRKKKKLLS